MGWMNKWMNEHLFLFSIRTVMNEKSCTVKCKCQIYHYFLLSPFLRNFFLCWDHWHGDVPPHLAQPCFVALGRALIWGIYGQSVILHTVPLNYVIIIINKTLCISTKTSMPTNSSYSKTGDRLISQIIWSQYLCSAHSYSNSDKLFLTMSDQYCYPERGFEPGSSALNIVDYLNCSATTAT